MTGVVVPAHNEAAQIAACLQSIAAASTHPKLHGERVATVVVPDHCTDDTAPIAARYDVTAVTVEARNVGLARAAGADVLLAKGARWLAFTDADTVVLPRWLVEQLNLQVGCGVRLDRRERLEHARRVCAAVETAVLRHLHRCRGAPAHSRCQSGRLRRRLHTDRRSSPRWRPVKSWRWSGRSKCPARALPGVRSRGW